MTVNSPHDLGAAVRGRRRDLGLSQAELAARADVSRKWIYEFEAGKPRAEIELVLRVLDALGLNLSIRHSSASTTRNSVDLDALLDEVFRGER